MTLNRKILREAAVGVAVVDEPEALDVFRQPGVAATIWRRQPLQAFQQWIDELDPARLPSTRIILRPDKVHEAVSLVCEQAGLRQSAERNLLVEDICALAGIFAGMMDVPFLRLRLDVIRSDACRKFHIDAVTARLICTYRGLGTQYGVSADGSEPRRVFTVATGAPVLLRGTKWPDPPKSGLLHRSPPIEGSRMTRLVLVIDPITDAEAEA